jgi:hypothetical protein
MIVASALGDLGIERRRIMPNGAGYERLIEARIAYKQETAKRAAAEIARRAALTPEQRAAEDAAKAVVREQAASISEMRASYDKTVVPGRAIHGTAPLNKSEKAMQAAILARDYDAVFKLLPRKYWKPHWQLQKYSFTQNGVKRYVPFSKQDITRWVRSPYWITEKGYDCPEAQYVDQIRRHWDKTQRQARKFPPTDWRHPWPLYPGRIGCVIYRPSTWVKIRKKVYIAAGVVTAAFLGPLVISKVGGMLAQGEAGGAIVGAGAKVGAAAKVGTAAKVATVAAKTGGYLATVQKGVGYINTGRTVNAIIHGDAPPPPIDISGKNWVDWGVKVASDELARDQQKKITAAEEARMRAELEAIQREIDAYVPAGTPIRPDPNLEPGVRGRIEDIQTIERGRNTGAIALAVAIPAALLLMAA